MKRSYSVFSSSPPCPKPHKKYDVFLSFRGEDTRNNFTGFLFHALQQKGIYTFLDDRGLKRGRDVSQELLKTVEESSCSVIILSANYANSSWCLNELVKILDCKKTMGQIVLPIFYHVDPTHVRKKTSIFGEAFTKHKQDFRDQKDPAHLTETEIQNMDTVLKIWEDALTEVANIAGWHLSNRDNEAKFIHDFVLEISRKYIVSPNISEDLFGIDSRIEKLSSYVYKSVGGVHFIGICGMGGIGKTTLARAFYNMASSQFEGSSFLANVKDVSKERWEGLKSLQEQLLSETLMEEHTKIWDAYSGMNILKNRLCRKKVIVIIDDVDKLDQLKKLAGKFDWFGSGSRIIITTRDESLLTAHGVKEIYNVELLNHGEALQLFTWNAFKNVYPPNGYAKLSEQVIEYANGLPLALEVLGSTLCGKSVNEWKSQLDRLKRYPKKEIIDVLQISFDELEEIDKNIFLDIACFFKGYDKDYVIRILDSCGYHPEIGVRNLIDKSLLSITYNNFWMHDLLQEMGWKIVREKSHNELGRQSRLWNDADLSYVLYNNKATEEIEAIVCYQFTSTSSTQETLLSSSEAFSKMKKLRLLKLYGSCILPSLESLSNELRFIEWNRCPLKCFPSSFQPLELVVLELQQSSIKQLWNLSTKPLRNLKIVNLSACKSLVKIFQDFTMVPNLEELILCYCTELLEVDPSINILGKLTLLDLSYCWSLDNLPIRKNGLKSLKVVKLYGCLKLRNLPEDIGHLKSLEELDVRSTSIRELPSSIVLLENLKSLSCGIEGIRGTNQLQNMINTIVGKVLSTVGLHSLKKLVLNACNLGEGAIPKELGFLVSLEDLDLSNNHFVCLPASISRLSKLKSLCLKNCTSLRSLTELPSSLAKVVANNCTALDTFLDPSKQYDLQCSALCAGCFKLARRQGSNMTIFTSLTRYLQKVPNTSQRLDIVLPGREISKWFTNQNPGSSISLNLSPNWCDNNWMGFAFCICFHCEFFLGFFCDVKINGQSWGLGKVDFPINDEKNVKPYHLWFAYLPRNIFFSSEWEKSVGQIEFSFETPFRRSLKVKMCGVRLVYQQDIREFDKKQKPNPF